MKLKNGLNGDSQMFKMIRISTLCKFLIRVQANNFVYIKKNLGTYEKKVIYLF